MYTTLNSTVYSSLDSTLKAQIASTRWLYKSQTKNTDWGYYTSANESFNNERNGACYYGSCYVDTNIGLINISDYKYATLSSVNSNCARTSRNDYNNACGQNNWVGKMMYKNTGTSYNYWTMSPSMYYNGSNSYTFYMSYLQTYNSISSFYTAQTCTNSSYAINPVFYLKNQTYWAKGNGTSSNPYYIAL